MRAGDRDHLVSQGWQRNFGTDDKRVAVVNVRTGDVVDESRAIKSNFAEIGFMTHVGPDGEPNRDADEVFRKIEKRVFGRIRQVRIGRCDEVHRDAVIKLCTIHLVRTWDFRDSQLRILDEYEAELRQQCTASPEVTRRYTAQYGTPPPPGAIEAIIDTWFSTQRAGATLFDSTTDRLDTIDGVLRRWRLQVVEVAPHIPGLALGDNPVVHADLAMQRFGFRDRLAVGDASLIMAPLSRRVVVVFTSTPMRSVSITTVAKLNELNALIARSARSEVACHPDDLRHVRRVCLDLPTYLPKGPHLEVRQRGR